MSESSFTSWKIHSLVLTHSLMKSAEAKSLRLSKALLVACAKMFSGSQSSFLASCERGQLPGASGFTVILRCCGAQLISQPNLWEKYVANSVLFLQICYTETNIKVTSNISFFPKLFC